MRLPMLLGLLCLSAPASAGWYEASSDHFVVYSEERPEELKAFAERLERYDKAMRFMRGLPDADLGPANRLTVYVVSNQSEVRKLYGTRYGGVAGFYIPRASGSVAVIPRNLGGRGKYDLDADTVLLHEYAHHFLFQNYAMAFPAWFTEGFAEFHSATRFEDDGAVLVGTPASHRAYGLIYLRPLPMERMLTLGGRGMSAEETETLYTRGWLLTHYLTFEPKRKGQLAAYLAALNSGKKGADAARAAFGDLNKLGGELEAYLKRRRMSHIRIAPSALQTRAVAVRPLSVAENAVMEVRMRSDRGVDDAKAKALLPVARQAAAPYPNDPAVQVVLAEAEYDAGNYKEALAAADRALSADPKSVDALIYKGRALMAAAEKSKAADEAAWKEARRWLVAANRADPNDPEPLILFYASFGAAGKAPTANAVTGLNRAYELAPHDRTLRLMAARQFLADGKGEEARRAMAPVAYDPHSGAMGTAAAAILAKLDSAGAAEALKAFDAAGKTEEAKGEESP